jgi:cyclohexadieny/prephenate dehydrogenase
MSGTAPAPTGPLFEKVALLGVGLIGSSLALACRRHGLAGTLSGYARSAGSREVVERLRITDSVHADPAEAVAGADLVVLCVPVGANAAVAEAIAPALAPGAIVTDVGSVKQAVIRDVGPALPDGVHFVPGHPIAGTEHSGPAAGFADLFEERYCVLTPPPGTDAAAVERVAELWRRCGARVEAMEASHHGTAFDLAESERGEVIKFAAGGFRDFTRIAGSDPVMWRDIFLNNREAVLEILQRFGEDLSRLQRAIRWGEGEALEDLFRRTREIRRGVVQLGQAGTFDAREAKRHEEADEGS